MNFYLQWMHAIASFPTCEPLIAAKFGSLRVRWWTSGSTFEPATLLASGATLVGMSVSSTAPVDRLWTWSHCCIIGRQERRRQCHCRLPNKCWKCLPLVCWQGRQDSCSHCWRRRSNLFPRPNWYITPVFYAFRGKLCRWRHLSPAGCSAADPIPTYMLKWISDQIAPFITSLFSRSLASTGRFPVSFLHTLIGL